MELPYEFLNKMAQQLITINSLLGGFSIAIVANLIVYKSDARITRGILKTATIAAGCFLVSLISTTKIVMMTTPGFPIVVGDADLEIPKMISFICYLLGILALSVVIAMSGWTKSRSTGIFTTVVSIVTFILILVTL